MQFRRLAPLILPVLVFLYACSTEFDLTAPEKDIWVIYGVLSPDDTVQYIRVSRGFLPESDAREVARDSSFSLAGLTVTLTDGNRVWEATQVDSVLKEPEDGLFFPLQTLYKFSTLAADRLQPDTRYELRVTQAGN
ncbi:MAG: hypothetical protein AAF804_15675, partial [Bacteroidota bacterium]